MDIHEEVDQLVESLEDDDLPREHIISALSKAYGEDHHVSHVEEEWISCLFPQGTRRFRVEFTHPLPHDGVCNHICMVYVYNNKSIAVEIITPYPMRASEITRRLTE